MYAPVYAAPAPRRRQTCAPLDTTSLDSARTRRSRIRLSPRIIVVPALRWSRLSTTDRAVTGVRQRRSVEPGGPHLMSPCFQASASSFSHARGSRCPRPPPAGFEPPTPGQYLQNGRALVPADNSSVEAGAKADLLSSRLALTGAAFGIRRTNIRKPRQLGSTGKLAKARASGIEAGLHGSLASGLRIDAGYAWTRTEITRDVAGSVGRELPNAPRHKANVWVRYRFPEGRLKHVMLATGLLHVSNRFIAGDNVTVAAASAGLDLSGWLPGSRAHGSSSRPPSRT